jgi:hypothetical protein
MQPSDHNVPWIVRTLTGPWHRRHARLFIGMELLVSVWLVAVGVLIAADGYWEGVLCFAGAALLLWFLYLFQRSVNI